MHVQIKGVHRDHVEMTKANHSCKPAAGGGMEKRYMIGAGTSDGIGNMAIITRGNAAASALRSQPRVPDLRQFPEFREFPEFQQYSPMAYERGSIRQG